MAKQYVVIKDTKEKLEVVGKSANIYTVKNSKGQQYNVPSVYLVSYEDYLYLKESNKK